MTSVHRECKALMPTDPAMVCCEPEGHEGEHVARGGGKRVYGRWRTEKPKNSPGVATPGDHAKALAFIASHELRVRQYVYDDGVTLRPSDGRQADAVQALAQAFADEREVADQRAASLAARLEESNALLRETIGICSDIGKLMPQISDALDAYAKPPPQALACGERFGTDFLNGREAPRLCELPRGHRGPHGASR